MGSSESVIDGICYNERMGLHDEYNKKIINIIEKCPQLDLKERCGYTGYIDFILRQEISSPLTGGYDIFHRPFIVVNGTAILENDNEVPFFQTFFQRYKDDQTLWVACNGLFEYGGGLGVYQKKALLELFEHGTVNLTDTSKFTQNPEQVLRLNTPNVKSIKIQITEHRTRIDKN
jgi:hypothetical protein